MTDPMAATAADDCGCPEYAGLTRRGLLRGAVLAGAGMTSIATIGSAFMETTYAATRSAPDVMVVLSMRGGVDGMNLVVPYGDPVYYAARPRIAVPKTTLLATNGFFGLHPYLAPLLPMWKAGRVAAVHATGMAVPNRSHFAAIEVVEDADAGSTARIGWLNRLIGRDAYASPLQAMHLGTSAIPAALIGPQPATAVGRVEDMTLAGADKWDKEGRRRRSVATVWGQAGGPLGQAARASLAAIHDYGPVRATSAAPRNGARYPASDLGSALASAARTIRGDVGAEVITIDHGTWDHHSELGTLDWGHFQAMTKDFAASLAAFFTDLGALAGKVTVVTVSEFGRRTKENASVGVDHGYGNVMLLLGAGVKGGYYGTWPGLEDTVDNDLLVTTDYRSVLSEVVARRLKASTAQVFPGFAPTAVGAIA